MAKATIFSHKNMTTPKPEDTTYKVMRLTTEGWTELDPLMAVNLTKEQCDAVLQNCINDGIDYRELKAVKDN